MALPSLELRCLGAPGALVGGGPAPSEVLWRKHLALLVHLALVAALMIVFPVSKLLHAPGVFFSPTRNQVDNPREKRWVAGWSAKIDNTKAAGN